MRVVAFAPSLTATEQPGGGVNLRGFPMTVGFVEAFPTEITLPVVLAVCGLSGEDYHLTRYIAITSPSGNRLATMEFSWEWPDQSEVSVKFRAFLQFLPFVAEEEGVYTIGLYESADDTVTDDTFPLPIFLSTSASAEITLRSQLRSL